MKEFSALDSLTKPAPEKLQVTVQEVHRLQVGCSTSETFRIEVGWRQRTCCKSSPEGLTRLPVLSMYSTACPKFTGTLSISFFMLLASSKSVVPGLSLAVSAQRFATFCSHTWNFSCRDTWQAGVATGGKVNRNGFSMSKWPGSSACLAKWMKQAWTVDHKKASLEAVLYCCENCLMYMFLAKI